MIIISLMVIGAWFHIKYYINVWVHGDEDEFFVIGKWTPGLIGIVTSIGIAIAFFILGIKLLVPIGLFILCFILDGINLIPILCVDGERIKLVTKGASFIATVEDVDFDGTTLNVGGIPIRADAVNYDRLLGWVIKNQSIDIQAPMLEMYKADEDRREKNEGK